jgi:hypothetical protein
MEEDKKVCIYCDHISDKGICLKYNKVPMSIDGKGIHGCPGFECCREEG